MNFMTFPQHIVHCTTTFTMRKLLLSMDCLNLSAFKYECVFLCSTVSAHQVNKNVFCSLICQAITIYTSICEMIVSIKTVFIIPNDAILIWWSHWFIACATYETEISKIFNKVSTLIVQKTKQVNLSNFEDTSFCRLREILHDKTENNPKKWVHKTEQMHSVAGTRQLMSFEWN